MIRSPARLVRAAAGAGLLLALGGGPAAAQQPPAARAPEAQAFAVEAERKAAEKAAREGELRAIEDILRANSDARAKLGAEIEAIRSDRASLNAALIATTGRVREAEERLGAVEERLTTLNDSAAAIRRSFDARRAVIVEVLAALQRMGRRPPPAVLVAPEDMLAAIRASILLGAVVPELRAEADTLASDLAELVRLVDAIASEQQRRRRELDGLVAGRERLSALIAARQDALARAEQGAGQEGARAATLAAQAQSLKELIQRLTGEGPSPQRPENEVPAAESKEARDRLAALAFKDPARLAPKITFAETKGLLPPPIGGTLVRSFGAPDGLGGKAQGVSLTARPGAAVSSPCDGWVSFAGPFRSFGQLLIINAGSGYYVLLAGMERINVGLGQFVLTGEPVAVMGDAGAPASAAIGGGTDGPVLYIEFRKDGGPIDPAPWWVKSQSEKARG